MEYSMINLTNTKFSIEKNETQELKTLLVLLNFLILAGLLCNAVYW